MISAREAKAVRRLVAGGTSQRAAALLLRLDRKTVARALVPRRARRSSLAEGERKARRAAIAVAVKKKQNASCMLYPSCQNIVEYLARRGMVASRHTVRRDLAALGYKSRVRRFVPSADPGVLERRVAAATKLRRIPLESLIFSDESYITCDNVSHRRQWVKDIRELLPRQKGQRGSCPYLMVWAAIGIGYKSPIILWKRTKVENKDGNTVIAVPRMNQENYKRRCLMPIVKDLQGKTLIQDGAKPHTAKATQKYLQSKGVVCCEWPAHSPDMNLIEHIWGWLKNAIARKGPKTDEELAAATVEAWAEISQDKIDGMIRKYRRKLSQVQSSGGQYR